MACCLFAAFLLAQCLATVRRWGIFWGLVPVQEGEDADTFFRRMSAWLERPVVRMGVTVVVVAEMLSIGAWIYVDHGTHLARVADSTMAKLRGTPALGVDDCRVVDGASDTLIAAAPVRDPVRLTWSGAAE
jgi:hypothetical protein